MVGLDGLKGLATKTILWLTMGGSFLQKNQHLVLLPQPSDPRYKPLKCTSHFAASPSCSWVSTVVSGIGLQPLCHGTGGGWMVVLCRQAIRQGVKAKMKCATNGIWAPMSWLPVQRGRAAARWPAAAFAACPEERTLNARLLPIKSPPLTTVLPVVQTAQRQFMGYLEQKALCEPSFWSSCVVDSGQGSGGTSGSHLGADLGRRDAARREAPVDLSLTWTDTEPLRLTLSFYI